MTTTALVDIPGLLAAHFVGVFGIDVVDWPILDPTPSAAVIWPGAHAPFLEPDGFGTQNLAYSVVTHQAGDDLRNDLRTFFDWAELAPGAARSFSHPGLTQLVLARILEPRLFKAGSSTRFIGQFDFTLTRSTC